MLRRAVELLLPFIQDQVKSAQRAHGKLGALQREVNSLNQKLLTRVSLVRRSTCTRRARRFAQLASPGDAEAVKKLQEEKSALEAKLRLLEAKVRGCACVLGHVANRRACAGRATGHGA